jgi:hypothetical protein
MELIPECNLKLLYNYYLNNFTSTIGDVLTNSEFNHICKIFGVQEIEFTNPYYFGTRSWFDHNYNLKTTIETINQRIIQMFSNCNTLYFTDSFGNQLFVSFDSENNLKLELTNTTS